MAGAFALVPLAFAAGNAMAAPAPVAPDKWTAAAVVLQQDGPAYPVQDKASEQEAKDAALAACKNRPKPPGIDLGSSSVADMCRVQLVIKSNECGAVALSEKFDRRDNGTRVGSSTWRHVDAKVPGKGNEELAHLDAFNRANMLPGNNVAKVLWRGCQA